jgi:phosphoglycerate dehydrogenase-like enzyme
MRVFLIIIACMLSAFAADTKKVVFTGLGEASFDTLKAAVPEVQLVRASGEALAQEIVDADGVIGHIRPEHLRAAKKLKWLQTTSAGVEGVLFPEMVESDVIVTNARGVFGPQIADHAMAFLLALTRNLNKSIPDQSKEGWSRDRTGMMELNGKTAVVIGVGSIGGNIAQRARAFGMHVIGVDIRDLPPTNTVERFVRPDRINEVIPQADVIFIAAPHTKKTEKMMGPEQFSRIKKGAYYIAMSRGKITDTNALVKALDEGRLAGAGLDVTDPEPLPKGHPLWKFPNVIITPHTSGGSDQLESRLTTLLIENLKRFSKDEPLLNVVNKREGF